MIIDLSRIVCFCTGNWPFKGLSFVDKVLMICSLGLIALVLGSDCAATPLAPLHVDSSLSDTYASIDMALASRRNLSGFVTTTIREHGRGIEKVVRFIKNTGTPVQLIREERGLEMPRMPTRKVVFVQNYDGFWELHEREAIRFMFPFRTEPTIPSRMAVAQNLCADQHMPYDEAKALQFAVDPEAEYFGTPCTKITLSLSPEMRALAASQQNQRLTASVGKLDSDQEQHRLDIPGTFVYYVAKAVPFVVCWQAFSLSGAKITEVSYQEFETRDSLDDAMFTAPKELKVITISDRAAYEAYTKERLGSASGKPIDANKK